MKSLRAKNPESLKNFRGCGIFGILHSGFFRDFQIPVLISLTLDIIWVHYFTLFQKSNSINSFKFIYIVKSLNFNLKKG